MSMSGPPEGGSIIRQLRMSQNWSLKDLAAKADVNYVFLSRLERGQEIPSEVLIRRLALALNYSGPINELIAKFGKVPQEIQKLILEDPASVVVLPEFFKSRRTDRLEVRK